MLSVEKSWNKQDESSQPTWLDLVDWTFSRNPALWQWWWQQGRNVVKDLVSLTHRTHFFPKIFASCFLHSLLAGGDFIFLITPRAAASGLQCAIITTQRNFRDWWNFFFFVVAHSAVQHIHFGVASAGLAAHQSTWTGSLGPESGAVWPQTDWNCLFSRSKNSLSLLLSRHRSIRTIFLHLCPPPHTKSSSYCNYLQFYRWFALLFTFFCGFSL